MRAERRRELDREVNICRFLRAGLGLAQFIHIAFIRLLEERRFRWLKEEDGRSGRLHPGNGRPHSGVREQCGGSPTG